MGYQTLLRHAGLSVIAATLLLTYPARITAQPQTAEDTAAIDLTGYWVSIVTEDWRVRMVTPPKGYYESVPLTPEGRRVADAWDPDADEAAGNECKAYGAAAIMRVPGRLNIGWEDANTLRIDTDAGMQTRLFHFEESAPAGERTRQGHSVAEWEYANTGRGGTAKGQFESRYDRDASGISAKKWSSLQ